LGGIGKKKTSKGKSKFVRSLKKTTEKAKDRGERRGQCSVEGLGK